MKCAYIKAAKTHTPTNTLRRFLLAQFYLTFLEDKTTAREVKDALRMFQHRAERKDHDRNLDMLAEAYDEVMVRINQQGENYKRKAHQVLSWVCYANRELYVRELQAAIAVREDEFDVDEDDLSDISLLLSVCCGIVVLGKATQTLQLVHYTAQDYFIFKQERLFPDVQSYLAKQCINYLSLKRFENELPVSGDSKTEWLPFDPNESHEVKLSLDGEDRREYTPGWYALYQYAAVYWGHHVRKATMSASDVDQAALTLLQSERKVNGALRIKRWGNDPNTFPNTTSVDDFSGNGLHLAAFCGLDRIIPLLMTTFEVNSKDSNGRSALYWATQHGWHAVVKQLLLADADLEAVDNFGHTAVQMARDAKVVQLLVDAGANMHPVNSNESIALRYATGWSHVTPMRLLMNAGIDTTAFHSKGWTALHHAAMMNRVTLVQLLIDDGVNVDAVDSDGDTALHFAAQLGHETAVYVLLTAGARSDIANREGKSALDLTVQTGQRLVYETICNMSANLGSCGDGRRTVLMEAVSVNDEVLTVALLEKKCDLEAQDHFGYTVIMDACEKGHQEIVETLLQHNPRLDIQDRAGETALMKAIDNEHWGIVSQLLHSDSLQKDPYLSPSHHGAYLVQACAKHQETFVTMILENGALNSAEAHNGLPFLAALTGENGRNEGYEGIIQLLVRFGIALTHCKEETSRTLIVKATKLGNEGLVRWLTQQGISVHGADETHDTPLVAALRGGHKPIVKLLRAEGARFTRQTATE